MNLSFVSAPLVCGFLSHECDSINPVLSSGGSGVIAKGVEDLALRAPLRNIPSASPSLFEN
jgi:hypothetical protein